MECLINFKNLQTRLDNKKYLHTIVCTMKTIPPQSVTARDIAKHAGVHQSTVSRVLSGFPRIKPETVAKVKKACDELGYVPNAMARSLRTRRPMAIALDIPEQSEMSANDPFVPVFLTAVGQEAAKRGYSLVLPPQVSFAGGQSNRIDGDLETLVRGGRVDGVIFTTPFHDDARVRLINEQKTPCVLGQFDSQLGPLSSCVDVDNIHKGRQAAAFLLSRGHRQIGVITDPVERLPSSNLLKGFTDHLKQSGVQIHSSLQHVVQMTFEMAYDATVKLLALAQPPSAILVSTALTVFGVMEAVRQSGQSVTVLGPGSPLLSKLYPSQPRIELPITQLGRASVRALVKTIESGRRQPSRLLHAQILDENNKPFVFEDHP
jgi:DNA-binding LacI/PurR family transcriptional regulator